MHWPLTLAIVRQHLRREVRLQLPKLHDRHHIVHWLHDHLHMAYFAGVYIEGHSTYAKIAGVLFLVSLAGMFVSAEHIE